MTIKPWVRSPRKLRAISYAEDYGPSTAKCLEPGQLRGVKSASTRNTNAESPKGHLQAKWVSRKLSTSTVLAGEIYDAYPAGRENESIHRPRRTSRNNETTQDSSYSWRVPRRWRQLIYQFTYLAFTMKDHTTKNISPLQVIYKETNRIGSSRASFLLGTRWKILRPAIRRCNAGCRINHLTRDPRDLTDNLKYLTTFSSPWDTYPDSTLLWGNY